MVFFEERTPPTLEHDTVTSVFFLFESSQGVREGVTALQQFALQVEGQERVEGEQEKLDL